MPDKYLKNNGSTYQEVISEDSTQIQNGGEIVSLLSSGKLAQAIMPIGIYPDSAVFTADQNISAGSFINVKSNGNIQEADNTSTGTMAHGYIKESVSSTGNVQVFFENRNTSLLGLTIGEKYYLGVNGGVVDSSGLPSSPGNIVQALGWAISPTEMTVELQKPVELA